MVILSLENYRMMAQPVHHIALVPRAPIAWSMSAATWEQKIKHENLMIPQKKRKPQKTKKNAKLPKKINHMSCS